MALISAGNCRIVFADKDKLVCLSYDLQKHTFRKIVTAPIRDVRYLGRLGDDLIAVSEQRIVRLNRRLMKVISKSFATGAICIHSDCIYVAERARLSILNEALKIVSSVELDLPEFADSCEDIDSVLIHGDIAYLSGHFQQEGVWSCCVDVRDRENMRVIDGDIACEYEGLRGFDIAEGPMCRRSLQFIAPQGNQWVLTQDHCNVVEISQILRVYPLEVRQIRNRPFMMKKRKKLELFHGSGRMIRKPVRGYRLVDVMKEPPLWAVIQDPKNNLFLGRLQIESNGISFANLTLLEWVDDAVAFSTYSSDYVEFSFSLRKHNNLAFVCEVTLESEEPKDCIPFHRVDLDRRGTERTECFNLADFGVRNVYDFIVF